MFDIHWLYRTSQYTIVKADVTKRHGIVIIIWQTSAIEVTALSKIHFQKWKVCKKKKIYDECEGQIEKSIPRDHSLTSLGKLHDARQ